MSSAGIWERDPELRAAGEAAEEEYQHARMAARESEKAARIRAMRREFSDHDLLELSFDDGGNVDRLAIMHAGALRYVSGAGWHVWDGKRYRRDLEGISAQGFARDVARALKAAAAALPADTPEQKQRKKSAVRFASQCDNNNRTSSMLRHARDETETEGTALDNHPWLFNCQNGTIDLQTGELLPHNQEDLLTKISPVTYDQQATAPRWERFISEIFDGNEGMIDFVQRALGYSLTGITNERLVFIMHGSGANGKSVLIDVVSSVIGEYASHSPSETFANKKGLAGGIPNDIARLVGTRFCSVVETEQDRKLAAALLKEASGGDTLTARFLNHEFFEFKPQFKIWLATNHKPAVQGSDKAMWDRIRLLPFSVTFADPGEGFEGQPIKDRDLKEKLLQETPGILRWMVEGCLKWQRDGELRSPDVVLEATSEYRYSQDATSGFVEEACHLSPGLRVKVSELYAGYTRWCKSVGEEAISQNAFGSEMEAKGFQAKKGAKGVRLRTGLDIKEEFRDSGSEDDFPRH